MTKNITQLLSSTAYSRGEDKLYHYTRYHRDRFRAVIENRQIYFSRPSEFNDPWDFKISFANANLEDPNVLERHLRWLERVGKDYLSASTSEQLASNLETFRHDIPTLRKAIREMSTAVNQTFDTQYRMFCTSPLSTSELMWAHYGNGHRGIAYEFAVNNQLFAQAKPVHYSKEYPQPDLTTDGGAQELLAVLTKSAAWDYECEYRLIAGTEEGGVDRQDLIPVPKTGFVNLPPASLTAVIVGCMISGHDAKEIEEILHASSDEILLKRVVKSDERYELMVA